MKIINVYLDDYDKPLLGCAVVNDDVAEAEAERIRRVVVEGGVSPDVIVVEIDDPYSVSYLIHSIIQAYKEDDSDKA